MAHKLHAKFKVLVEHGMTLSVLFRSCVYIRLVRTIDIPMPSFLSLITHAGSRPLIGARKKSSIISTPSLFLPLNCPSYRHHFILLNIITLPISFPSAKRFGQEKVCSRRAASAKVWQGHVQQYCCRRWRPCHHTAKSREFMDR